MPDSMQILVLPFLYLPTPILRLKQALPASAARCTSLPVCNLQGPVLFQIVDCNRPVLGMRNFPLYSFWEEISLPRRTFSANELSIPPQWFPSADYGIRYSHLYEDTPWNRLGRLPGTLRSFRVGIHTARWADPCPRLYGIATYSCCFGVSFPVHEAPAL